MAWPIRLKRRSAMMIMAASAALARLADHGLEVICSCGDEMLVGRGVSGAVAEVMSECEAEDREIGVGIEDTIAVDSGVEE
jgi:hypothetical protein